MLYNLLIFNELSEILTKYCLYRKSFFFVLEKEEGGEGIFSSLYPLLV